MGKRNKTLEILISCMNQKNFDLLDKSNINSNALMVNQCDRNEILEEVKGTGHRKMICSTQRGLSRSRNLAMEHATGDIILFADDDEVFEEDVEKIILEAFSVTDADIIAFDLRNYTKNLKRKVHKLTLFETLKISSCQIACKRKAIQKINLVFDVNLGAGTPNGAGEENKFLWDAYKAGLTIFYYPVYIAQLNQKESTWFAGFNKAYFYERGKVTGYFMGKSLAFLYAMYFIVTKYRLYKKDCCFMEALTSILKGIRSEKDFSNI